MAVRARTVVTLGVERPATERTRGPTGFDETRDGDRESARPLLGECQFQRVLFFDGLERDLDGLGFLVDRDGDVARDEVRLVLGFEAKSSGRWPGRPRSAMHLAEPLGQSAASCNFSHLTMTRRRPWRAWSRKSRLPTSPRTPTITLSGCVEDVVHDGASSFSDPVVFTHSTSGVPDS